MNYFSKIQNKNEINQEFTKVLNIFSDLCHDYHVSIFGLSKGIITTRNFYTFLNKINSDLFLFKLIKSYCRGMEERFGDCFLFLSVLLAIAKNKNYNYIETKSLEEYFLANKKTISEGDLGRILGKVFGETPEVSVCYEAVKLAGLNGKIFLQKSKTGNSIVELKSGYNFSLQSAIVEDSIIGWQRKKAKCIIIDGIVESLGEINNIFEGAAQEKVPVVIMARGFFDDICATIRVNRLRRTLDVLPILVPYDLKNANVINDLAIVCGTDIVSSLKGQLISAIPFGELPIVDSVDYNSGELTILNSSTDTNVKVHIANLEQTKQKQNITEIIEVYESRMKSLISLRVNLEVGGDPRQSQEQFEKMDNILKFSKYLLQNGILKNEADLIFPLNKVQDVKSYPVRMLFESIHLSQEILKNLQNTHAIITNEKS